MSAAFDTNMVLRLHDRGDPLHSVAVDLLSSVYTADLRFVVAPQVLYEARAVLTRPKSDNGFGATAEDFRQLVEGLLSWTEFLPDPPDLVERWMALCETHGVIGKRSHDVRLVAWMQAHDVENILTLNPRDFATFPIKVLSP